MKKKITWEYLLQYAYDKNQYKDSKESIVFRYDDKYYLGFAKNGQVKLFPYPDWWINFVVISKKMSYEDMFFIIKQQKEIITAEEKSVEEATEKV